MRWLSLWSGTCINGDGIEVFIDSTSNLGTAPSSREHKIDIKSITDSDKLQKLRPVSFRYKIHSDHPRLNYGLIAEETLDVFPDLIVYLPDGTPTIQYHKLHGIMIAEIQRLYREHQAFEKSTLEAVVDCILIASIM